jgi:hypothetical protein
MVAGLIYFMPQIYCKNHTVSFATFSNCQACCIGAKRYYFAKKPPLAAGCPMTSAPALSVLQ